MNTERLSPGCMIAWEFDSMAQRGEEFTIETMRACMESAPTYPEAWTREQGREFVRAYLAQ